MTDLSQIPGLSAEDVERLDNAGFGSVEDLRAANAPDVAEEVGCNETQALAWINGANRLRVITDVKGIGPTTGEKFIGANILTVEALAEADADELAPLVGMKPERVITFQERAKELLAMPLPDLIEAENEDGSASDSEDEVTRTLTPEASGDTAAAEANLVDDARRAAEEFSRGATEAVKTVGEVSATVAGESLREGIALAEEFKVILKERAHTARVRIGKYVYEDVPIVVARVGEDLAEVRDGLKHDAVILQERASTAVAKVGDKVHENMPLVQEKLVTTAGAFEPVVEEVRVKVLAIKDKAKEHAKDGAAKGKGLLGKMFGKK